MPRYDVTDQATLAATPAEIFAAIEDEAAGRSQWWRPWLAIRQLGEVPYTQVGGRALLTVSGLGRLDRPWATARFEAVVTEVERDRRLAVDYVRGDFHGSSEWTLEPVDDARTHVVFRWLADPAGAMRLWARLLDVPRNHSRVIRKGFTAMEVYIAERRALAA